MLSKHLKVGLVTLFSCLALMLGLLSSTGIASAHSTQALQSQASASTLAADNQCRTFLVRTRVFTPFFNNSFGGDFNSFSSNRFGEGFNPFQQNRFGNRFGNRFEFREVARWVTVCTNHHHHG